ncbi:hypothetical protein H0X48_03370 [Candidatus Dependentiae bacterium]|nr:hypothetical protein [Candidatus Dependentiae bacterium]
MLGVKKSRVVVFVSLLSYSAYMHSANGYDTVTDLSLDLWAQVDLVRSINTTHCQKEAFIEQIAQETLALYAQVAELPSQLDLLESRIALVTLLTNVCQHIEEVFEEISHPALTTTLYVLSTITTNLKAPAQRTS